jgi:Na+/melibiose symporter-like transporter
VGVFSWVVPTYAKTVLGIATGRIGLLLLVNAAIVVVAQVPVARALEGRRRAPSLALACVAWAVAYAFVAAAPRAGGAAYGLLVVASVLVAVGECLHAVALFPLAAQLARRSSAAATWPRSGCRSSPGSRPARPSASSSSPAPRSPRSGARPA